MVMLPQRAHLIDPALAKRRTNVYNVGPSLHQHRRNVSCSPELNNIAGVCKCEILKATVGSTLLQCFNAEQSGAEQNRTEQNRTEQNRTEQNRTNRTEQNRTEQNRTEQNRRRADQSNAEQRSGQNSSTVKLKRPTCR